VSRVLCEGIDWQRVYINRFELSLIDDGTRKDILIMSDYFTS